MQDNFKGRVEMKSKLFLCGAGNAEGVRLALRVNEKENRWQEILILDDDPLKKGKKILDVEIAGPFDLLKEADPENCEVANLVARTTKKRFSASQKIKQFNLPFATLIDPNVDVWGVEYKKDITVYQNVTFSAGAFVDEGSVVFTGAVIGHGCKVGKGCVIAPGAVLNARVELGDGVYIGTNASVLPDLNIGNWSTIGINSAIIQNIPEGATAMGVPAEILMAPQTGINGKVLPKPIAGRPKTIVEFTPATNEIEKALVSIWKETLKIDKIGIDDDFFDLGGHSLSAVQIGFQIQKKLNVNIPLQSFFDSPTIRGLSKKIEAELVGSTGGADLEKLLDEIEGVS